MDDYISREAIKSKKVYSADRHEFVVPVVEIDWIPTSDVVEVVRCIDCKYYNSFFHNGFTEKYCGNHNALARVEDNGFCHFAERRAYNG